MEIRAATAGETRTFGPRTAPAPISVRCCRACRWLNTNSFGGLHIIELLEIEIGCAQQCIVSLIEYDRCAVNISTDAYGRSCMNGPIDYRRMCITCATGQAGCPKRMMPI
jgi:hypothetical protein